MVDHYGWTPLLWASYRGDALRVAQLVEERADIERCSEGYEKNLCKTPLIYAIEQGHAEVVCELLLAKANPRACRRKPYCTAADLAAQSSPEIRNAFESCIPANESQDSELSRAAVQGGSTVDDEEAVQLQL